MNIALVAHDSRKEELKEWVKYNWRAIFSHQLYATGTTGSIIEDIDVNEGTPEPVYKPIKVNCLLSGPLGGDFQIGAMIAEGKIDLLIFFCDNLIMQGHQNDVSALTRLASLYNIAFATNRTTADMILTSPLFNNESYHKIIPGCIDNYKHRMEN
jgi:methylglyoxal synthase